MKQLLARISFRAQLVGVICLFALIPTLFLGFYIIQNVQTLLVQSRMQDAQLRTGELAVRVQKNVELCYMSTQVFLNTPALTAHLVALKENEPLRAEALMEFYQNDIAGLEKVVLSNPYLYQIRVYAMRDDIEEMMPLLFSHARMQRMPWAQTEFVSGTWQLDFEEQLFPNYPVTQHVTSLVTKIETAEHGQVGVLEVAVKMDALLPELYGQSQDTWAGLVSEDGACMVGDAEQAPAAALLREWMNRGESVFSVNRGTQAKLVSVVPMPDFGCVYVQTTSLAGISSEIARRTGWMIFGVILTFLALMIIVLWLTKRMLRGFYAAFDSVKAFSEGDLDASVQVAGDGEVARFARSIQNMLDKIRQLMHDNLAREMLAQNSQLRALQNQINAHFIYNVLEAIKMMAEIDEKYEIADAVTNLGKLLRYSMKWDTSDVLLADELAYIENYLALMNLRYDYVCTLICEIPQEMQGMKIPKMSLQPLVENAVIHGAQTRVCDAQIIIRGTLYEDACTLAVVDFGKGMTAEKVAQIKAVLSGKSTQKLGSGNGIGLKNVQDRIHMTFGNLYDITITSQPGQGTEIVLHFPRA